MQMSNAGQLDFFFTMAPLARFYFSSFCCAGFLLEEIVQPCPPPPPPFKKIFVRSIAHYTFGWRASGRWNIGRGSQTNFDLTLTFLHSFVRIIVYCTGWCAKADRNFHLYLNLIFFKLTWTLSLLEFLTSRDSLKGSRWRQGAKVSYNHFVTDFALRIAIVVVWQASIHNGHRQNLR